MSSIPADSAARRAVEAAVAGRVINDRTWTKARARLRAYAGDDGLEADRAYAGDGGLEADEAGGKVLP
jgi:hypothetical protein